MVGVEEIIQAGRGSTSGISTTLDAATLETPALGIASTGPICGNFSFTPSLGGGSLDLVFEALTNGGAVWRPIQAAISLTNDTDEGHAFFIDRCFDAVRARIENLSGTPSLDIDINVRGSN